MCVGASAQGFMPWSIAKGFCSKEQKHVQCQVKSPHTAKKREKMSVLKIA